MNICSATLFMDSGAHGLYNIHVLKHQEAREFKLKQQRGEIPKHRKLGPANVQWGQGDFSFYDLAKGTEFRKYCDGYAQFIKETGDRVYFANVDVISNPKRTWEVQRFFEEEHGVQPIPIVHAATPMKDVDRYLNDSKYRLLGVGGLGQGIVRSQYFKWGDEFFRHIEGKKIIRTHGFAMTSFPLMARWPWWSVDSATWVKLSAYGWLYVPRTYLGRFDFDHPPFMVNFSHRSPQKEIKSKHYSNVSLKQRQEIDKWLEHLGIGLGSVKQERAEAERDSIEDAMGLSRLGDRERLGKEDEFGVVSHHRARAIANLRYLTELGQGLGIRIYFSGGGGLKDTPEVLIPEHRPHIMLTYHNIHQNQSATLCRLEAHLKQKK